MREEIQKFFKGEVEDSEEILSTYSRDASIFILKPKVVVFPLNGDDVRNLVRWVGENKEKYPDLSITARSAGTDMSGGAIGESIVMDFTRHMNRLINFNEKEATITVEPGMFYRDFEKITLKKGMVLPCYTASKNLNAMGGMFGNNSAGERTLKYGKTEDYVEHAKIVFSDGNEYEIKPIALSQVEEKKGFEGEVYKGIKNILHENEIVIREAKPKVHKNSAGYYLWNIEKNGMFDLNKLLVGSQGTLGIVTEITFRLVAEHKYSKLVAIFMNNLEPLGRLVDDILTLNPETLETYDDKTLKLAVRFFPDFLKNKGIGGMLKLGWNFIPEFFMMLRGGFPKLVLLAEFEGESEQEADMKCKELKEKIRKYKLEVHVTKSEAEAEKYWDVRRESFALLRKHVKGLRTAPFIDDIIVRPEFLPRFLPELKEILGKHDLVYTLAGHAGDGNFHIIPLMDFTKPETPKIIMELSDKVYDLVIKYQGSITAEHNDGIIRTPYLPKMYGDKVVSLFTEVKKCFDPKNIFNPGKKTPSLDGGGTKEYLKSHIAF